MKATGITRPIDELGRIVIPKELRKSFGINAGDTMEIFTAENGRVIMQKHQLGCVFCGRLEGLEPFKGTTVCKECRLEMKNAAREEQSQSGKGYVPTL